MLVGDKVTIISEKPKIVYVVDSVNENVLTVSGLNYRIRRNVRIDEVVFAREDEIEKEVTEARKIYYNITSSTRHSKDKYLLGTILHVDGDKRYLDKCLKLYEEIGCYAYGINIKESMMSEVIDEILREIRPDIIVITGHDSYNNQGLAELKNYNNTENFIEVIKKIRLTRSSFDCCIIAGACQSNFEALIAAGANFASSPKRINIHTYDPAVIAVKVASTSFMQIVNFKDVLKYIKGGREAFGGVETLGKMKLLV